MIKLFNNIDIDSFSKIYVQLGYKEIKRTAFFNKTSIVKYHKEEDIKNFKALNDRYAPYSTIPFFFVILFAILAIGFASAFLLINILNRDIDKLFYFYILMIPTFIFTLIVTAISFYRYFVELKNIERVAALPLLIKEREK